MGVKNSKNFKVKQLDRNNIDHIGPDNIVLVSENFCGNKRKFEVLSFDENIKQQCYELLSVFQNHNYGKLSSKYGIYKYIVIIIHNTKIISIRWGDIMHTSNKLIKTSNGWKLQKQSVYCP